jgi:hypothetical protein
VEACCKTAVVSFHENFWLAASTTAPVITLAVVVVIPDAARIRFRAARREQELLDLVASTAFAASEEVPPVPVTEPEKAAFDQRLIRLGGAVRVTRRNVRLCYVNLFAQAALLCVSLAALAYSRDFVPPWLAIVVAVGGVGLLTWTLLRGAGIRDGVERAIGAPFSSDG